MASGLGVLAAAASVLCAPAAGKKERAHAEASLRSLVESRDDAIPACLALLCAVPAAPAPLQLVAAHTLRRTVIGSNGGMLTTAQAHHLTSCMLRLCSAEPSYPVLAQLGVLLAGLAALHGAEQLTRACGSSCEQLISSASSAPFADDLPPRVAVNLLRILAEEAASDWPQLRVGGLLAGQRLEWAAAARASVRNTAPRLLPLLLAVAALVDGPRSASSSVSAIQHRAQQHHVQGLSILALEALAAWVRLGALHCCCSASAASSGGGGRGDSNSSGSIGPSGAVIASGIVDAALAALCVCCNSSGVPPDTQLADAAASLLMDVIEHAPEQALAPLAPRMLAVATTAAAAAAAATSAVAGSETRLAGRGAQIASACCAVFAAYVGAVTHLLAPSPQGCSGLPLPQQQQQLAPPTTAAVAQLQQHHHRYHLQHQHEQTCSLGNMLLDALLQVRRLQRPPHAQHVLFLLSPFSVSSLLPLSPFSPLSLLPLCQERFEHFCTP